MVGAALVAAREAIWRVLAPKEPTRTTRIVKEDAPHLLLGMPVSPVFQTILLASEAGGYHIQ
jgi:hypothetical protein